MNTSKVISLIDSVTTDKMNDFFKYAREKDVNDEYKVNEITQMFEEYLKVTSSASKKTETKSTSKRTVTTTTKKKSVRAPLTAENRCDALKKDGDQCSGKKNPKAVDANLCSLHNLKCNYGRTTDSSVNSPNINETVANVIEGASTSSSTSQMYTECIHDIKRGILKGTKCGKVAASGGNFCKKHQPIKALRDPIEISSSESDDHHSVSNTFGEILEEDPIEDESGNESGANFDN